MGAIQSTPEQQEVLRSSEIKDRICKCPICLENYNSYIVLCESGHAVCHECSKRLEQCPRCTGKYYGTRNYALEDILEELNRANIPPETIVQDIINIVKVRVTAQRIVNAKVAAQTAQQQTPVVPVVATVSNVITGYATECRETTNIVVESQEPQKANDDPNEIMCKMLNCQRMVTLDGLRKHLRKEHKREVKLVLPMPNNSKSYFNFETFCTSRCYALDTEIGIFYVIVNINEGPNNLHTITAWIQGTRKDDPHRFYSFIEIQLKGAKAFYQNFILGARETAAQIEASQKCLRLRVGGLKSSDDLFITGFVCFNGDAN